MTWSTPGSNVLVLSSYEPTHWTIDVLPGGQLDRIVTLGYHVQTVDAPPGVLVETYDYESGRSRPGRRYPSYASTSASH